MDAAQIPAHLPAPNPATEELPRTKPKRRHIRWSVRLALLALVVALPSSLWRVLMVYGMVPGTGDLRESTSGEVGYVVALTVIELLTALAVLGLTLGWYRPITRHTRMPWWLPGTVGLLGGAVITWLFTYSMVVGTLAGKRPDEGLVHGAAAVLMVAVYAPLVVWGPLVLGACAGALGRERAAARAVGEGNAGERPVQIEHPLSDPHASHLG